MEAAGDHNGRIINTETSSFHVHESSFRSSISSDGRSSAVEYDIHDDEVELQWAAIERLPTFERVRSVIDVAKLGAHERRVFVDKLINHVEHDNRRLLQKLKQRIDSVGVDLPTVEVRYQNLFVEADCEIVNGKPLPTLWNTLKSVLCALTQISGGCKSKVNKLEILKDVSGIIKPSRLWKTTLLQALAGILNPSLKVSGETSYNGFKFDEFVPQKTSAYISQYDVHTPEMTVRETLNFSARCQGIGSRADMMKEVSRREKQAGIIPEPDIDTYMKAISIEGLKGTLLTDYIIKILGLEICADTIVGDVMKRGISGGQKKRLTTAEMIIGPTRVLFMDEISNGLDSSTTFQIVTCLQQLTHITESTILVSLLQPAPETFDLFDDIILMAEGKTVYHGPRDNALEFLSIVVVSKKDQGKYWHHKDKPYSYIEVDKFVSIFKDFHVGKKLAEELSKPFNKYGHHKNALSFSIYSLRKWELLKACTAREWLLMKRNSFVYIFKSAQLVITAVVTMTVFLRTRMNINMVDANFYLGSLFYALMRLMGNGVAELALTSSRLEIFYKQRDFYFYPAWSYSIPAAILKIPFSFLDAFLWTVLTYYVIGYSPEPERFLNLLLLLFLVHQVSVSLFRFIASVVQNEYVNTSLVNICDKTFQSCSFSTYLATMGFWLCPMAYAEIGVSVTEFLAPRWQKLSSSNVTLGQQVLRNRGLNFSNYFYWLSMGALLGFWMVFNIAFTCALSYLKRLVLAFEPIAISFENVQYFIDIPKRLREEGFPHKRLLLLDDITGAFRPGILTALMGVSGAGKTTLMDVLSGRKTSGIIKGDIRIGGYPKVQKSYARISGYCEQIDVHSPNITVGESVTYSAWLRLPSEIDRHTRSEFVAEVLQMIELDEIKDELVGVSGVSGISNEQRKRLTIAVELVSNPSIIFMDEPTSGLDARAAAIVMRVVKNIASTSRTVVCTVHQPSIDIFDSFDELILLKRGGQIIYSGELGQNSRKLIEYFEGVSGVPKIKENYNPATWMLEVTGPTETQLGLDFANLYKESQLCRKSKELVRELSSLQGSKEIHFSSCFPQNGWEQFKACLWKQHLSYWRNPSYNLMRLIFITVFALVFGALLWQKGQRIDGEQDLYNILGSMFVFIQFMGIGNCSSVLPLIASDRTVVYRERFAGMYSPWAYAFSQVIIEIPYVFLQAFLFSTITYPAINFHWSVYKVCWYFYSIFCTLLYFNYMGSMIASLTPTLEMASVVAPFSYTMLTLFAGFIIPEPKIPKWWVWAYWICPTAWSLKGLLTSQYGDLNKEITIHGERKAIDAFLQSYYGYDHDDLGVVAFVLLAYPLVFAFSFSCATAKLNFQKR
ncbi:hypothetical protein FNV43_RR14434 [Rhamnella rubrinervis]|uniref:ABC transporter domain-containing protein n=1 Tax=Rhamnella rubrinervis TaxID=2594499 RepID=A0A8K0MG87_9ROSA|nr:hypothetical protein FNV43_RR14434 [Rhamnella rubrinervis]